MEQETRLHDEVENEVVEEAHDPKNAEAQSVASVAAADDGIKKAPARKGDQSKQDPMPKTKAGMINAMFTKMNGMSKAEMAKLYQSVHEGAELTEEEVAEIAESSFDYEADFSADLNALVENEATLSEEFKEKAEVIFEAAIKTKLSEEIDRLEAKYEEELAEEVETTKADLVEKVDSYLNYVVEQWMEDNKLAIQSGLRAEIAENFMTNLKDLFTESYIEVPESKVDLVDELAETVEELEEKLNNTTGQVISMSEELEEYKREAIIRESARGLAETQVEKLKSLVEDVEFEDEATFAKKVDTIKESYFTKKIVESADVTDIVEDDEPSAAVGDVMSQYLSAIKKTNK